MNFSLMRHDFNSDGIFGELWDSHGNIICLTGEHAYPDGTGWAPKLPNGVWICKRGIHHLKHVGEVEAFEAQGVPNHTGMLMGHIGNYCQKDSEGCVLFATGIGNMTNGGLMLTNSKLAMEKFMELVKGLDEITVTVENFINI